MGWLLQALSILFRCLPQRWARALGSAFGWIWYHLVPVRRRVALSNLRASLPELPEGEHQRIARAAYRHWAQSAVEFLRLPSLDRRRAEELVDHVGWEHLESAMAQRKGVVVATAHFGNFDLLACVEALRGVPLHVVTRSQHLEGINRFWMQVRTRTGLSLLPDKKSIFKLLHLLRQNQVVALMIDQHMPPGRGIPVPFFGQPASTTHAPALLALTTGAPILPATIERLAGGRHRVVIEPVLQLPATGRRSEDVKAITLALNRWLEGRIRERPDHWLWIHRRWKLGLPPTETPAPSKQPSGEKEKTTGPAT